jgi:hypothetical protein
MAKRKSVRRETIVAIAFASGILNSSLPALCANEAGSCNSFIQDLVADTQQSPELRCLSLLNLANAALIGRKVSELESQLSSFKFNQQMEYFYGGPRGEHYLVDRAKTLAASENFTFNKGIACRKSLSDSKPIPTENLVLANEALRQATRMLNKAANQFQKLNLLYIASCLYRQAGNVAGANECDKTLERVFKSCESTVPQNVDVVRGSVSVLNAMAYGIVPVDIPMSDPRKNPSVIAKGPEKISEKEFSASEKLRLRAAGIADRLPASDHTRRLVHRDLTLWYGQMGRPIQAEWQKIILFNLVGVLDESILYPQSAGCGHLTWWKTEKSNLSMLCGMG